MSSNPNLSGTKVESGQVGCNTIGEESLQAVVDTLLSDIDHFDILHEVVFLKLAKGDICTLICLDTVSEISERALAILVLVIQTAEL